MFRRISSVAAAALLLFSGCSPQTPQAEEMSAVDTAADEQALSEIAEREIAAMTSGDIEGLGALFAEDATIMPPNEPTVTGVQNIEAWAAGMQEDFMVGGRYTSVENHVAGDFAYQWMTFELELTPRAGGEAMMDSGRGLHVLARQPDGSWRIVLDIWNSTLPAEAM